MGPAMISPLRSLRTALISALPALLLATGCAAPRTSAAEATTLTVFAAASLSEAFQALAADFEAAHPGTSVAFNFGGSQQLAQQLAQGAPADLFASANALQMQAAVDAGRVDPARLREFARNRLVMIVPAGNPGQLDALPDLARPGLRLVLAAPEVPVGQYALEFLDKASRDPAFDPGYKQAVLANVVSFESSVKSVLAKVALDEADAGIVYTSDLSGENARRVAQISIPDALNVIAVYPLAPLVDASQAGLAQAFRDYVLSAAGQQTLARFGFLPVNDP